MNSKPVKSDNRGKEGLVTIGMPVHNGEETVGRALDSLLAQTYTNFEIIISDNASTDGTREICLRYQAADPRIKYFRNEEDIGAFANFNRLVEMGEGELFMWAAHDDLWEPDFLEELVGLLAKDPYVALAFCEFDGLDVSRNQKYNNPNLISLARQRTSFGRLARFLLMRESSGKAVLICGVMRREAIRRLGGMYTGFRGGEYALDNHTLFLMGMENRFAISDRVLFHKGFESEVEPYSKRMPNSRDIYQSLLAYRVHITGSDLKRREKLALQALATLNFMRSHTRNLIGRALIKFNLLSPVLRYYRMRSYR